MSDGTRRPRVAVVGAGVAGISAAYHLRDRAEIAIFERNDYAGGHANTVAVHEGEREIGIDTGFIVFNKRSYPRLSAFFEELGVEWIDHEGGYNFFDLDTGVQFGTPELDLEESEVAARYSPGFVSLWKESRRFFKRAQRDFVRGRTDVPLGEYLDNAGFSEEFKYGYILLLGSAVWSIPPEVIWEMPASTLIAFFLIHDAEGLGGRSIDWRTVLDGSRSYVRRALEEIGGRLELNDEVVSVRETADGVEVVTASGSELFDFAVVATHADEALQLVDSPTDAARDALSRVRYNPAVAVVHRDASLLPPDRERWQSWNYGRVRVDGEVRTYVTWWMNRLQGFEAESDWFLTLDPVRPIRAESIERELPYMHPVITVPVREMQTWIYEINDESRVKYAGSYFHSRDGGPDLIASHEAAFSSGIEAAAAVSRALDAARLTAG
jgi:uncharacterized protein